VGIDNSYRALPANDALVRLAREDNDIAEDALFPVLLFDVPALSDAWVKSHPRAQMVRDLVARYPKLQSWHLYAGRWEPIQLARLLYYGTEGEPYAKYGEPGFEESLALRFAQGDREFSAKFKSSTGFPVRVSWPEAVRDISEFGKSIDVESLPGGLYREIFIALSAFYRLAASDGNLAVFFMRN
jgi:hypothetical protein